MRPNKYKYVSLAAMIAVMLLLGLYMWMTYRSAVRDISERAGNQLPWAMFYESYNRAEILSKGDTLSLPQLRGDLSLVSSVEGMNDVLSRKYHSEISLDTLSVFVDSLLSVVNLNRDFTILEVDHQGSILRRSNNQETSSSLKTRVFSIRRDQSKGIQLALNNPYPELARRLSPLFLASAIILILFGVILLRLFGRTAGDSRFAQRLLVCDGTRYEVTSVEYYHGRPFPAFRQVGRQTRHQGEILQHH